MRQDLAIEMAPFTVAPGYTADALIAASDRLERDFLSKTDGYIGRVLVQKDANAWADIVFWKSADHAEKAMQAAASSEACRAYFQCMAAAEHDDPAQDVTLFRSVKTSGSMVI